MAITRQQDEFLIIFSGLALLALAVFGQKKGRLRNAEANSYYPSLYTKSELDLHALLRKVRMPVEAGPILARPIVAGFAVSILIEGARVIIDLLDETDRQVSAYELIERDMKLTKMGYYVLTIDSNTLAQETEDVKRLIARSLVLYSPVISI